MKRILVVLVLLVNLSLLRDTHATNCEASNGGVPWDPSITSVRVYIHRNIGASGPDMGLIWALTNTTNYTELQVELAVIRALHIFNEEVGGRIKLQYMGFTSSTATINNAILIRSNNPDCSGHPDSEVNDEALAQALSYNSGGYKNYGVVKFFTKSTFACSQIPWTLNSHEGTYDFVKTLLHELGHNFYDLTHPDQHPGECGYQSGTPPTSTIMHTFAWPPRARVIKDFDKWWFQTRHGVRSPNAMLLRSYREPGSLAPWQSPFWAFSATVMQRPGSMGQNSLARYMGLHIKTGTTPGAGGGAQPGVRSYENPSTNNIGAGDSMLRPLAIANRRGTSEVMVAFVERANGHYLEGSDIGNVCYKFSSDGGVTFAPGVCPANWRTYRHGLTATYDERSRAYLIGFVDTDAPGDIPGYMFIGIVPSPLGSSVSTPTLKYLFAGSRSWHPPALACRRHTWLNDQYSCRAVWEGYITEGCATTIKFGINTTTPSDPNPTYPAGAVPDSSPCVPLVDTPGLIYNPVNDRFHMAVLSYTDTIYTYVMPTVSTDWSLEWGLWYVQHAYVSSPVLTFRDGGIQSRVQAWFVKYN